MGDLMGDLRNNPRPPFPPGQNGGPIPPQDPIRQPMPPRVADGGPQMAPPTLETGGTNVMAAPPGMGAGGPVAPPPTRIPDGGPQMAPPGNSMGQGMNSLPLQDPIRRPLPPQMSPRGREFSGGPTFSPGAPKMTDQTNNARKISAPRIPPMSGGTPAWYGKNAPQGGSFTPPPSAGLMTGQDRKRKGSPFA